MSSVVLFLLCIHENIQATCKGRTRPTYIWLKGCIVLWYFIAEWWQKQQPWGVERWAQKQRWKWRILTGIKSATASHTYMESSLGEALESMNFLSETKNIHWVESKFWTLLTLNRIQRYGRININTNELTENICGIKSRLAWKCACRMLSYSSWSRIMLLLCHCGEEQMKCSLKALWKRKSSVKWNNSLVYWREPWTGNQRDLGLPRSEEDFSFASN